MPPAEPLVVAANAALADPNVQATVRQMHEAGAPLLQMIEALGLDDEMSDRIRQIVSQLSPDVVAGIRQATIATLDSGGAQLPLDCSVTLAQIADGTPVSVDVPGDTSTPTIRIRPGSAN